MGTLKSKIESLLFISGDPLSIKKISKILKEPETKIKKELELLTEEYKDRGIVILLKNNKVQMVSNPENSDLVEKFVHSQLSEDLTPAALETLAVVAYKEPISREDIDKIRGVNSVFSLRALLMRGLVEKTQKDDVEYYKTSLDFLKKLGISKVSELPEYEELSKTNPQVNNDGE